MQSLNYWLVLTVALFCTFLAPAQQRVLYKQIDSTRLYLEYYTPTEQAVDARYPAMVFFFGGGWNGRNFHQFREHARYFADRGIVCFLADYRVNTLHGSTPFAALKDAKSAIRFVRKHADTFSIDPARVIASGGSPGGHLAAAAALVPF